MNNLITISDFSNPYLVFAVAGADSEDLLNEYITKYQKDYLIQILGHRTYNVFDAACISGVPPTSGFWYEFIEGVTYPEDSVNYIYPGIKPVLVKLLYYWWHRNTATILGEKGELKANYQKLVKTIPAQKMVSAYNDAIEEIQSCISYAPTVYHYMNTQYTGDDWLFTEFENINTFNL